MSKIGDGEQAPGKKLSIAINPNRRKVGHSDESPDKVSTGLLSPQPKHMQMKEVLLSPRPSFSAHGSGINLTAPMAKLSSACCMGETTESHGPLKRSILKIRTRGTTNSVMTTPAAKRKVKFLEKQEVFLVESWKRYNRNDYNSGADQCDQCTTNTCRLW